MRWLVASLVAVIVIPDILSWQLSLAPGLSVKNAVLYLILFGLVFRAALRGLRSPELPALHAILAIWLAWAVGSWLAAALLIRYPHYDLIANGITLKAELGDSLLFFLVAFHGLSDIDGVKTVLKALAAGLGIANLATLTDVAGLTHFGVMIGTSGAEAGRVFGVFGHANDTAALIDCLLPLSVAVALTSRGIARVLWCGGALASFAVLILTISRGAYVAFALGALWAVWLLRRSIPLQKVVLWVGAGVLTMLLLIAVASVAIPDVGEHIARRLLGGSSVGLAEVSSGRTVVWAEVVSRMLDNPITLLTGFGWDVYYVMPFRYATHNYYLHLWFNLGLVGLGSFIAALAVAVSTARRGLELAPSGLRPHLTAAIFGMLMLAVAAFFGDLAGQWDLIWIYIGTAMRATMIALSAPAAAVAARAAAATPELEMEPRGLARSRPH